MPLVLSIIGLMGLTSAAAFSSPPVPTGLEASVVAELNFARQHPQTYEARLRRYRRSFVGQVAYISSDGVGEQTIEGPAAVEEAMRFVDGAAPLQGLSWDPELAETASAHAEDQRRHGGVGHSSSEGLSFSERVRSLSKRAVIAEVISYGETSQQDVVRQLIVDDGEFDRGHRSNIFEPDVRKVGVACRPHPEYGYSCVIDLASN